MKSQGTPQRSDACGSEARPCAPSEPFTRSDSFRYDDQGLVEHQIIFTATNSSAGRCQGNNSSSSSSRARATAKSTGGCCGATPSYNGTGVDSRTRPAGSGQPVPKGVLLIGSALLIGVAVLVGMACLSKANKEHPNPSKQ